MKIIVTGSLGHISKPLTTALVQKGHQVTVISSNVEVEMYASLHSGLLGEDYNRNKPTVMGKVKLKDFAKEFAAAFKQ